MFVLHWTYLSLHHNYCFFFCLSINLPHISFRLPCILLFEGFSQHLGHCVTNVYLDVHQVGVVLKKLYSSAKLNVCMSTIKRSLLYLKNMSVLLLESCQSLFKELCLYLLILYVARFLTNWVNLNKIILSSETLNLCVDFI